ncbi:porin [Caenispirillum bisanense]|uniref:Outer membrane protein OmpU n=1 Tax=Caenispirillum bisanense TaxID=414052 RepID=A0A286GA49_9PROT|nr:porin [Caenispirillum bisanense]SOD92388.1 outer membrane protein OmpU [Caenispirillum bisanense]
MKKVLLGTSALIAAGLLAAPASAAEKIKLGLGGKMEQYFGVVSQDDTAAFDPTVTGINTDAEVYFSGATTLDNGLTVGAMIQLEAQTNTGNPNADEQYAYIEGAFGKIMAGQKDGVLTQMAHEAPQYGLADDDVAAFFNPGNVLGASYSRLADTTVQTSDSASVHYISPSLAGFTVGASFFPAPDSALQANTETSLHNQFEVALAYNGEFSGVAIGADVAYLHQSAPDAGNLEDPHAWRAGLVVGYAGFQVGGSYLTFQDRGGVNDLDSNVWNAGIGYKTGPYGVSLVYLQSDVDLAANTDNDAEYRQWSLHGTYAMGPGVTLAAALFHATGELDFAAGNDLDADGTGGIVGLQLSF